MMAGRFFLFLFAASLNVLCACVEDHFKKITDKSGFHCMRNIDFIYMINLDRRPEKFESCTKQLHPYGIYPYRFSAVNGWEELSVEAINDVGVKYESWMTNWLWGTYFPFDGNGKSEHEVMTTLGRTYFCHCMSRGAIGIVLSHLSILQDAYDSGYETIWVMEDDIQVIRDPNMLSDFIERLDQLVGKNGWDILFTDLDTKDGQGNNNPCWGYAARPNFAPINIHRFIERVDISPDFRRIGARYGAYSMIVRRSGMKKLLEFIKYNKVFLPYDMEYILPGDISLYTVSHDVVSTQPNALSDNGVPNYKKP